MPPLPPPEGKVLMMPCASAINPAGRRVMARNVEMTCARDFIFDSGVQQLSSATFDFLQTE
jgi:hypothetical protein